ncbi:MAG: hypothetical protein JNK85_02890 [Verrucomicrobiales bacterium]|nr:hypothetical protein [Verrucomicrobiales bacterium]
MSWTRIQTLLFGWVLAMAPGLGQGHALAADGNAAPTDRDEILFLRLRITGDRAELLEAHRVPGQIVPTGDPHGTLEITITDAAGTWSETVRASDPCLPRLEFEDPDSPGNFKSIEHPQSEGEAHIRMPAKSTARRLTVTRLMTPAYGPLRTLRAPARLALGEFELSQDSGRSPQALAPQGIGQPPTNSVPVPKPVTPILVDLATNGPSSHRIDIAFLAEGYRTNELSTFTTRANAVLKQLLQTPPYADYQTHFNALGVFVPSAESGADHPSRNISRDTYFDATYDSSGIDRLITLSSEGRSRAFTLLREQVPAYDLAIVLVNDEEYGGSGGSPLIASADPRSALIAVHEIGHSYASLGDEYEAAYPGYPDIEEPNTTTETNRDQIKWRAWIAATTPVPTPATASFAALVGLFEGAHYHSEGWFRPKLDCGMRTLGSPFCEVCSEQLILETHRRARLIERTDPGTSQLLEMPASDGATLSLEVTGVQPTYQPLRVTWEINGTTVAEAGGTTLTVHGNQLASGTNAITATLRDATTKVRTDLGGYLQQSVTWLVAYSIVPPTLQVSRLENGLRLQWVESATAFQLESASALATDSWQTLSDTPSTDGSTRFIEVPVTGEVRFYRLKSR